MKKQTSIFAFVLLFAFCGINGFGQRNSKNKKVVVKASVKHKKVRHFGAKKSKVVVVNNTAPRFYKSKVVIVKKRRIRSIAALPNGYSTAVFGGVKYYYHSGLCYSYENNAYRVRPFPIGFRVTVLPFGYYSFSYLNGPHYYYRGTYYVKVKNAYVTKTPSPGMIVPDLPEEEIEHVNIGDQSYLEYDDVLYKPVEFGGVTKYEVIGLLSDDKP